MKLLKVLIVIVAATVLAQVSFAYGMLTAERIARSASVTTTAPVVRQANPVQTISDSESKPGPVAALQMSPEQLVKQQAQCARIANVAGHHKLVEGHLLRAKAVAAANGIDDKAITYYVGFADGLMQYEYFARGGKMPRQAIAKRNYTQLCPASA